MQNLKNWPLLAFATLLIFSLLGTLNAQGAAQAQPGSAPKQPGKKMKKIC